MTCTDLVAMDSLAKPQLTMLNEALLDIHGADGIDGVLSALVAHIPKLVAAGSTAGFCVGSDWEFSQVFSPDLDTKLFDDYKDYYEPFDVYKQVVFGRDPVPPVDISSQFIDYRCWERSPHRTDFLIPNGMYHLAGIQLLVEGQLVGDVCIHREKGTSDFSPEEIQILRILQSQASLACRNSLLVRTPHHMPEQAYAAYEPCWCGVMIFDRSLQIAHQSASCEHLKSLYTLSAGPGSDLPEMLASSLSRQRSAVLNHSVQLNSPAWRESVRFPHGVLSWTVTKTTAKSDDVLHVVTLEWRDSRQHTEDQAKYPFGLSAREFELARLLTRGMNNSLIAMSMSVSPNTVKTHLKSIMRKTKTHSKAEVVYTLFGKTSAGTSPYTASETTTGEEC